MRKDIEVRIVENDFDVTDEDIRHKVKVPVLNISNIQNETSSFSHINSVRENGVGTERKEPRDLKTFIEYNVGVKSARNEKKRNHKEHDEGHLND